MKNFLYITIFLTLILAQSCKKNEVVNQEEKVSFLKPLDSLQNLQKSLMKLNDYEALSIGIIRPDTTVVWDFGKANETSLFRIGSVSKSFVGLSIMKLVEQNKVSLDDTLTNLIPEIEIMNPWEDTKPILLRHLVEASAGFISYRREDFIPDPEVTPIQELLKNNPYTFESSWEPGKYSTYHNVGPMISAYIVEKKSNMSYESFVRQYLFEPMEMDRTYLLLNEDIKSNLINYNDSTYEHIRQRPSGAIITSNRQLLNLVDMLIHDGIFEDKKVFENSTIKRFETSTSTLAAEKLGITYGHAVNNWTIIHNNHIFNMHGGVIDPGFLALYLYSSELNTGLSFTFVGKGNKSIFNEILALVFPYLEIERPKQEVVKMTSNDENTFIGCYKQITKSRLSSPEIFIEIQKDSLGNLQIYDSNFDEEPNYKSLKPTSIRNVYLDDNPLNNFSLSGQSQYAFLVDENGNQVIQKLDYSWEAYEKIECEKD